MIETDTIREHMFEFADEQYQQFHSGLVPGNNTIIGVRVPVLRGFAKELTQKYHVEQLLEIIGNDYYEEIMLQGMLIGLQKNADYQTIEKQICNFVPKIDNWAVCDTFCAGLKIVKKYKKEMLGLIESYLSSDAEFERRFAIVMLLEYYVEPEYLALLFQWFDTMNREGYYVQMAVGWAVSVCFVKAYEETLAYMKGCRLDDVTYQKAIQKALESYRIDAKHKEELRELRRRHFEKK